MHIRLMACGAALIALAGCLQMTDNPVVQTPTGAEIALKDGLNCWQSRCFNYDAEGPAASLPGREAVSVAAQGTSVTAAEFASLLASARSGAVTNPGRDDDGGSSGGAGVTPPGGSGGDGDDD